jgi:hypothetical protein
VSVLKQVKRTAYQHRPMRLRLAVTRAGAPMSLTSAKFAWTIKRDAADLDADAVFQVTSAYVADPATGVFEIELPKDALAALVLGDNTQDLAYDIVVEDSDGKPYELEIGVLTVFPTVTKSEDLT